MSDFNVAITGFVFKTKDAGEVARVEPYYFRDSNVVKSLYFEVLRPSYIPSDDEVVEWVTLLVQHHFTNRPELMTIRETGSKFFPVGITDFRAAVRKARAQLNGNTFFRIGLYDVKEDA